MAGTDHTADLLAEAFGTDENVWALLEDYRADNSFTDWDDWVDEVITTVDALAISGLDSPPSYADALPEYVRTLIP